jgi:hypothetical protein
MQHPRIFPDGVPHCLSWATISFPEGSLKGLRRASEGQKFRSLRAPDILAQAPVRTPCSIIVDFGADRAEIRPIGAIT